MSIVTADNLSAVPADDWNELAGEDNIFIRHEFLSAMETHDCLHRWGWSPIYFLHYEDSELTGACACYLKSNSYGEFVFDWAWADAYERKDFSYYPKLVCSVPFTPARGPRLLAKHDDAAIKQKLIDSIKQFVLRNRLSSCHWLFCHDEDIEILKDSCLLRYDYQFHWHNQNYSDFDDFLSRLKSKRRKNIRRERRSVEQSDVEIQIVEGKDLNDYQWHRLFDFYRLTFLKKSGTPTFTLEFFKAVAKWLLFVFAEHHGEIVAGSIFYKSRSHLYGRHWGCDEHFDNLHFELCYYQGIDYAIENKIKIFEPGAQGEHKIWRGFVPVKTRSAHYIEHEGFRTAIDQFLSHERSALEEYAISLQNSVPYRSEE